MAGPGKRKQRKSPEGSGRRPARTRRRRILVVDDAEGIRTYLVHLLEQKGFDVDTAEDGRSALALLEGGAAPDAVLLDIMMPGIDGIETLRRIRAFNIELPVVMLSVVGRASSIVQAMQLGAVDYLNKPFEEEDLDAALEAVFDRPDRQADVYSNTETGDVADPSSVVWSSRAMSVIEEVLTQIANTDVTVLIQGESGTGKEIVARAVHERST
ncbi:MAG: sigma-54-dependent Fis family transcriptional regulator, partial [Deltaproteobacteria bacterium]|nr:sigma-54-dependent Fis family transcriptional regulator [Deltaproteobacteria bacterium]